jgi:hypothetical protein
MKYVGKTTTMKIILILLLILFLTRSIYSYIIEYNNNKLIQQILNEWKRQTGGSFKKSMMGVFTDDYFLYFPELDDQKNHIHLVTNRFFFNNSEFFSSLFHPRMEVIPTTHIGYIIKKNNSHFPPSKISPLHTPHEICYNMIRIFKTEDVYCKNQ